MKHIIWCPTRGWRPEAWCLEVRDPQKYGPCYHCMYGARGRGKAS
ncbi:MAG: hypothetical protein NWE83_10965 [Candidatus Bathyarchaeota archaeon]|nr:hypothetical protein [Candidatus Bathyarchaeota archaeon]